MDLAEILQAVLKLGLLIFISKRQHQLDAPFWINMVRARVFRRLRARGLHDLIFGAYS